MKGKEGDRMDRKIIESNYNLAFQIKEALHSNEEVKNSCKENPSGELSFFIRDGQLQILSFRESKSLILDDENRCGMKDESFSWFVSMFSNYIKRHSEHLYHLKIVLNYRMDENGVSFRDLNRDFIHEHHYKRR
ncbi:hypothetical protein ACTHO0_26635 [Cytobacillus praedii]|uniref:hypothetical protein n=1 Tax=Cytobacillus praedii TaxID=1742358 RepID=UPI003F7E4BC1